MILLKQFISFVENLIRVFNLEYHMLLFSIYFDRKNMFRWRQASNEILDMYLFINIDHSQLEYRLVRGVQFMLRVFSSYPC